MSSKTTNHTDTSSIARSYTRQYNKSIFDLARMAIWFVFESEIKKHKLQDLNIKLEFIDDSSKILLVDYFFDSCVEHAKTQTIRENCSNDGMMFMNIMKIKLGLKESRKLNADETRLWNKINQIFRNVGLQSQESKFTGGTLTKTNLILNLTKFYEKTLKKMQYNHNINCTVPL
jgi:hypothetical protein